MNWRIAYTLKNSIYKIKEKTRITFPYAQQVNNFKIFGILNEKFIFLFCELCKGVHNTFMVKVGRFIVLFKIIPFWVTSWLFKKVPYVIALTCNYGHSHFLMMFLNTWLLFSDKPYCIRRVRRCSYDTNCASWNKFIVS